MPSSPAEPFDALLIHGASVFTPTRTARETSVLISNGRIAAIGSPERVSARARLREAREIDASGLIVAPGFIDIQINGAAGQLITTAKTADAILTVARLLPRFGCTAFLPTVISAPLDVMRAALHAIGEARSDPIVGARILGAHLEGPFLNPESAGAHPRAYLQPPSAALLRDLWEASRGSLRVLTIAPELDGARETIEEAGRLGIVIAIGHSRASIEQAASAQERGVRLVTHLFNASGPVSARKPGIIGAALTSDGMNASLIPDGVHVHPAMMRLALRALGAKRLVLVTDAMPPIGSSRRTFDLLGAPIEARDGACYTRDGRLAGGLLTMDEAVRSVRAMVDVGVADALAMATRNPARVLGLDRQLGSLRVGAQADLAILSESLEVRMTIVGGRVIYRADQELQRMARSRSC
ncbi:MAG TPA: N-acetylglucosamine-6-phosphate deacetylase [Chloroflexota bacterium]|nr:N-acetylglucosamine-6-phosphate deacetylase [Chloroflexota bacterium]